LSTREKAWLQVKRLGFKKKSLDSRKKAWIQEKRLGFKKKSLDSRKRLGFKKKGLKGLISSILKKKLQFLIIREE
jgi:hypothetical protein